ncbi:NAD(P)/FAD-dependent oxidoreductase [Curvivirga sp.]|uniref:NAD(P)/FAD-dependent oxidoreductase n=1 Tax=Curvivirga sp. TaxID=2856848 RepID=UPI003B5C4834
MQASSNFKTTPYWWEEAPLSDINPNGKNLPTESEFVIVGGGFTGLSAALTLARAGKQVTILEAQRFGEGASSRNGGICSGNLKPSLETLVNIYGMDFAKEIYEEGVLARKFLANLIEEENIECDFKMVGRFSGANHPSHYDKLAKESDYLNEKINLGSYMVSKQDQHDEIGSDLYFGGAVREDIGGLHPAKFHRGLLNRVQEAKVSLHSQIKVNEVIQNTSGCIVKTSYGDIKASKVIVGTNGYSNLSPMNWMAKRIIPIRSQIIATEEMAEDVIDKLFPKRRMHGTTLNLYNYFRPAPNGKGIIFGGRSGADRDDPVRSGRHLYKQLIDIFPEIDGVKISHTWSGYTGYTFDHMPHIKQQKDIVYAGGYCGSGVVWAPWVGTKTALMLLDSSKSNTTFSKSDFETRPLYNGTPWFVPPIIWWYAIKDKFGW